MNNLPLLALAIMLSFTIAAFYSPEGQPTGEDRAKNKSSPNDGCPVRNPNINEKPARQAIGAVGPQFPYSKDNPLGYKKISEATNPQNCGDL